MMATALIALLFILAATGVFFIAEHTKSVGLMIVSIILSLGSLAIVATGFL